MATFMFGVQGRVQVAESSIPTGGFAHALPKGLALLCSNISEYAVAVLKLSRDAPITIVLIVVAT
jgi:hypothetical protein